MRLARRIGLALLLCSCARPLGAAFLYDPALRFQVITTPHFSIYFHQGEARAAARLAAIAEDVWQKLQRPFEILPPPRTHVVLVDQTELANGSATPLPYDAIMITAAAPAGSEFIGRTDDWLRLVFTHEFTHIVHLDRSRGWARAVRGVFGRVPLAFPNVFLPTWQIEGLATYQESRLTGEGRLDAGDFRQIERQAARMGRMEPLDRLNGGLTDWPGGTAAYAYGLGFHQFLADRYGEQTIAALANRTAGRVPYTQSRAFKGVYGKSLGTLWREYEQTTVAREAQRAPERAEPTRLTRRGFVVSGPRIAPPACATCQAEIVFAVRNPNGFPSLDAVHLDGSGAHQLTTRYLGSTSGVSARAVVFDQQELRRDVALFSDLFWLDRRTGRVRRMTSEARVLDPDLSPDGASIACVREGNGLRDLVIVRLGATSGTSAMSVSDIIVAASAPGTQYNAPRWSPDGSQIAAERRRPGHLSEIVTLDVARLENRAGAAIRVVASNDAGRIVTPAWRPDGQAVVAAVEAPDGPFNLFEFPLATPGVRRQLTSMAGGATWPDISPDGKTIVFAGYTADGFDLFSAPYPSEAATTGNGSSSAGFDVVPSDSAARAAPPPEESTVSSATPYRPWATLAPTSWTPVIDTSGDRTRVGVGTAGIDVLGYHSYVASAAWRVSATDRPNPGSRITPDWNAAYAYSRWRPIVFAAASRETSNISAPGQDERAPIRGTLQETQIEAGVLIPFQHIRHSHRAFASLLKTRDDYLFASGTARVDRSALRAAWASATAKRYGYSISAEDGISAGTTAEFVRPAFGASGTARTLTADVRAYLRGLAAHHVLAVRAGGGTSSGNVRRIFVLGGPTASPDVLDFGSAAFALLRAFPTDAFAGYHVAVANLEYRFPLARPQRGVGTWPVFLHTVHAAVVADAGQAWVRSFRAHELKTSVGAELSFNVVAGYGFPFTITAGAAHGHDPSAHAGSSALYVRVGRSF